MAHQLYCHSVSKAQSSHWGPLLGKPAWPVHCSSPVSSEMDSTSQWWPAGRLPGLRGRLLCTSQHCYELTLSTSCAELITVLCFSRRFSRDTDSLISLSPLSPSLLLLPLPSVGSTSSSPALLGIRDPRSEYDRTQPPMQYYNSQGDATHKGLYPGKMPVGCAIEYLEKPRVSRHTASGLGSPPCLYWDCPPAANDVLVSPFPASGAVAFSAWFKLNKLR